MSVCLARSKSAASGGIFVFHAWYRLDNIIKELCNRFAALGYLAMAPDLYADSIAITIPKANRLRTKINRNAAAAQILKSFMQLQTETIGKRLGLIGF